MPRPKHDDKRKWVLAGIPSEAEAGKEHYVALTPGKYIGDDFWWTDDIQDAKVYDFYSNLKIWAGHWEEYHLRLIPIKVAERTE